MYYHSTALYSILVQLGTLSQDQTSIELRGCMLKWVLGKQLLSTLVTIDHCQIAGKLDVYYIVCTILYFNTTHALCLGLV